MYYPFYPRLTATDGNGTTAYDYYPPGQLGANRLATLTEPHSVAAIDYAYDALGRVASRTIGADTETFGYDVLGRLESDDNALANFTYGYLGETGQVTSMTPDSGPFSVAWQYLSNDDDRRLQSIQNSALGGSQDPQSFGYQTDAGNRVTASVLARDGSPFQSFTYDYDADNRLTRMSSGGVNTRYSYDDAGNLQYVVAPGPTVLFHATYNALNQIATANGVDYSYDAAGELVSDGVKSYTWDAAHRLASVTDTASGAVTHYGYDGLGRRVMIRAPAPGSSAPVTTYYVWCGAAPCQERDASNTVIARYFAEGEQQNGTALLYGRDRLGSVTDLVDGASGSIEADYAYDPWGNVTSATGTAQASFGYAGMFTDRNSGLNLTLYRAYNPAQYRWLSRDPLGESIDTSLYRYVFDNPLNLTDRLGLQGDWGQFTQTFTGSPEPPTPSAAAAQAAADVAQNIQNMARDAALECLKELYGQKFSYYQEGAKRLLALGHITYSPFEPRRLSHEGAEAISMKSLEAMMRNRAFQDAQTGNPVGSDVWLDRAMGAHNLGNVGEAAAAVEPGVFLGAGLDAAYDTLYTALQQGCPCSGGL